MNPLILINAFEVPAAADEQFVAHWTRARDALSPRPATWTPAAPQPRARRALPVRQHRSLGLTPPIPGRDRAAGIPPTVPVPRPPRPVRGDLIDERLTVPRTSVTLINPFEVPAGEDEQFIAGWERATPTSASSPATSHQPAPQRRDRDPDFRFVNVARWASAEAFTAAITDPSFQAAAKSRTPPTPPSTRPRR